MLLDFRNTGKVLTEFPKTKDKFFKYKFSFEPAIVLLYDLMKLLLKYFPK